MPTVLRVNGFTFGFFSADCAEPRHLHVRKGSGRAKFWLDPAVSLVRNDGFKPHDLRQIQNIIEDNVEMLRREWDIFCSEA